MRKLNSIARYKIVGACVVVILTSGVAYKLNYNNQAQQVNSNQSTVQATYQMPTHTTTILPRNPNEISRGGNVKREIKKIEEKNVEKKDTDFNYVDKFTANVTKYSLHPSECGWKTPSHPLYGITASGKRAVEGITIATSNRYKFGTKIKIEGFKSTFVVQDRGGAIVNNCIDVFVNSRKDAQNFGRKHLTAYVIEYPKK